MSDKLSSTIEQEVLFEQENTAAEQFIEAKNLPAAARILVEIVGRDQDNHRAYNNIGIIAWMQKAWADAYAMFKKSVQLKPDYTDAQINLFDAALKLHCIHEIYPLLKKGLQINPANEELSIIVQSIESQGEGIYQSQRALAIGTYNPAVEEAQKLLEDGQLIPAMEKYLFINDSIGPNAEVYCGLGVIAFYQQHYSDAYILFLESIKLNPINPDIFYNFFDAARACDKSEEAVKVFKIYSEEFPILRQIKLPFDQT